MERINPFISVALSVVMLLSSCTNHPLPPKVNNPVAPPIDSVVALPIEISMETIKKLINEEGLKGAATSGQTPEKTFNSTVTDVIAAVGQAAVDSARQVLADAEKKLREFGPAAILLGGPLYLQARANVEAARIALNAALRLYTPMRHVDRAISTSYVLSYSAKLKAVERFEVSGNRVSTTLVFEWSGKVDVKEPITGVVGKGVLAFNGVSEAKVAGTLKVDDNLKINVALEKTIDTNLRSLSFQGFDKLNLKDLIPLDGTALWTSTVVGWALDNLPLGSWAQKGVDKGASKLAFAKNVRERITKLGRPTKIANELYLDFSPTSLAVGQPTGTGSMLLIPVELRSGLRVVASSHAPEPYPAKPASELPITVASTIRRTADIQLLLDVPLQTIKAACDARVNEMWAKNGYAKHGYEPMAVDLWETEKGRFVALLPMKKTGESKASIKLVASGELRISENKSPSAGHPQKELRFEKIEWDAITDSLFVKTLQWLARDKVQDALDKGCRVSLDALDARVKKNMSTTHDNGGIVASFILHSHSLEGVTVVGPYLRVIGRAIGEPTLRFK